VPVEGGIAAAEPLPQRRKAPPAPGHPTGLGVEGFRDQPEVLHLPLDLRPGRGRRLQPGVDAPGEPR
jgi:hypothetical protein